ncbi:MAG: 16S rRNA (adenine(1518)-N(6)/adenine(1519)-N(6))-dimethyltransferase RsmA [Candidatus Diapherotrites archaeon]
MSLELLQRSMVEAGFFPEKRYSQNFLIDERVVRKLVDSASLTMGDCVIEIGGGTGLVTEIMAQTPARITTIELHAGLAAYLKKKFSGMKNVTVIEKDFLQVDLNRVPFNKVVASPPYAISDDIMYKLFQHGFERGSFIWQMEFAEKMLSPPGSGEYHPLSVIAQHFYDGMILSRISPTSFYPVPNHFSGLLVLKRRKKIPRLESFPVFVSLLKTLFRFRNKTMENALKQLRKHPVKGLNHELLENAVRERKLGGEKVFLVEPEDFVRIFHDAIK